MNAQEQREQTNWNQGFCIAVVIVVVVLLMAHFFGAGVDGSNF